MRKKLIVIMTVFLILVLLGCAYINSENPDEITNSELYSLVSNTFSAEYSGRLYEFAQILKLTASAATSEDISYVMGRIDGYGYLGMGTFKIVEYNDKVNHRLITKEIEDPLYEFIYGISDYLDDLDNYVLRANDAAKLDQIKDDLNSLAELTELINDQGYKSTDQKEIDRYLTTLDEIEEIMQRTEELYFH